MPKARKNRTKLHLPSAVRKKIKEARKRKEKLQSQSESDDVKMDTHMSQINTPGSLVQSCANGSTTKSSKPNIFSGVEIAKSVLYQKLPDFDTETKITSKTFRGMNIKKKDKLKIRHEAFVEKIKAIQSEKKKTANKRKKSKTPVVGDMSALSDTLPTLEMLMRQMESKTQKPTRKERSIPTERVRMKRIKDEVKVFQQVLSHSAYKVNPGATIREHLRNKLQQDPHLKDEVKIFQQVLSHSAYKANPGATIREHLRNKLQQDPHL